MHNQRTNGGEKMIKVYEHPELLHQFLMIAQRKGLPTDRSHGLFWYKKTQELWEEHIKGKNEPKMPTMR